MLFRSNNHHSVFNNITPAITRYILSQNPSEEFFASDVKRVYFIYTPSAKSKANPFDNNFYEKEIFHKLVSQAFISSDEKKVYHLDASCLNIEQEVTVSSDIKISEYYLNYLRSLYNQDANV